LKDVGSKESIVDLTNLVDSEDDSSDDESLSFESDEFIGKGLWIAGQENTQKASHKPYLCKISQNTTWAICG
jgi:hypothetical protein